MLSKALLAFGALAFDRAVGLQLQSTLQERHSQAPISASDPRIRLQAKSGLCLNGEGAQLSPGDAVILWWCDAEENEKFKMNDDGTISVVSRPDLCMNVEYGVLKPGQRIILWNCGDQDRNEQFHMWPNGTISVKAKPELCLNAEGGKMQNGDQMILWPCGEVNNEMFAFRSSAPLDFCEAETIKNNLGGHGPAEGYPTMRFRTAAGVDFVVKTQDDYKPNKVSVHGLHGCFGQVTMKCGESVTLQFVLRDSATNDPLSLDDFWFTLADIDAGVKGRCRESVEVSGYESYYIEDKSFVVEESANTFVATHTGAPQDENSGTDMAKMSKKEAIAFHFKNVHTFNVTYHTDTDVSSSEISDPAVVGFAGRRLQFAGTTSLTDEAKAAR